MLWGRVGRTREHDGRDVCVVGAIIMTNLFGGAAPESAVGREIRIDGRHRDRRRRRAPRNSSVSRATNYVLIPDPTYKKYSARAERSSFSCRSERPADAGTQDQVRHDHAQSARGTFRDEDDGFALETQDVLYIYTRHIQNTLS